MKGYSSGQITAMAKELFREERALKRLDGWFFAREEAAKIGEGCPASDKLAADQLEQIVRTLPLSLSDNAVFAGTQRDAFARTYALINPAFTVESFAGYCDPTAVFDDIVPNEEINRERIDTLRTKTSNGDYVRQLSKVYETYADYTEEVVFFVEQVTGHVIPDFRKALEIGLDVCIAKATAAAAQESDTLRKENLLAMCKSMACAKILADRYRAIALEQLESASQERKAQLQTLIEALEQVPAKGARNLYEAIQSFILLWQVMCLEQAPNPFAFSVGNADRIFEPYRAMTGMSREEASELLCCLLVFFNVGDRSWAISQNILVGGRDVAGNDLTNEIIALIPDAVTFAHQITKVDAYRPEKGFSDGLKGLCLSGAKVLIPEAVCLCTLETE